MRAAAYLGIDDDMDSLRVIQRVAKRHGERVRRTFPASFPGDRWARGTGGCREWLGRRPRVMEPDQDEASVVRARRATRMGQEMTCPMSSSAAVSLGHADLGSCARC
jgi:hypothetical protein